MAKGFRIASAWVEINADATGLKQKIKTEVEQAAKNQEGEVGLKVNSKGLRREIKTILDTAAKGQKGTVDLGVRATGLRSRIQTALTKATAGVEPQINLGIRTAGLRASVQTALKAATVGRKPTVDLAIRTVGLKREVKAALAEATGGEKPEIPIGISTKGLRASIKAAVIAAAAGERIRIPVKLDIDRNSIQRVLDGANPTISPTLNRSATNRLRAALQALNLDTDAEITPIVDGDFLRARIKAEVATLRDRFTVNIAPDIDANLFREKLIAAARTVRGGDIEVDFNPNVNRLKARLAQIQARSRFKIPVNLDVKVGIQERFLRAQVEESVRRLNNMRHDLRFRASIDEEAFNRQLGHMGDNFGGRMRRMGRITRIVLAVLALGPPVLAALGHAFLATAASSAVLVTALSSLVLSAATIMVGMNGIGEAVTQSNLDMKKYRLALTKLTPSARAFVEAIVNSKGAFNELQTEVQEEMFRGLSTDLRAMASDSLPALRVGLGGTAMQLRDMASGVMQTTSSLANMGTLDVMFGSLLTAMDPLVPVPGQILNAIVKLTTAGAPLFIRMTEAFGRSMDSMTEKIDRAFVDGRLQASITKAGETFVQFFRNIGNNPEWEAFIQHLQENGPRMAQAFTKITEALMKLLNAVAPVSGALIKIIEAFSRLIIAIPTGLLTKILGLAVAFKLLAGTASRIIALAVGLSKLRLAMAAVGSHSAMMAALGPRMARLGASAGTISATAVAMRGLAMAGGAALGIGAVLMGIKMWGDAAKGAAPDVDKLAKSLNHLAVTGKATGEFKKSFTDVNGVVKKMHDLADATKLVDAVTMKALPVIGKFTNKLAKTPFGWIDSIVNGSDSLNALTDDFKSLDSSLAKMVEEGNGKNAALDFKMISEAALKGGFSLKDLTKLFPEYKEAVATAKAAQEAMAKSMGVFGLRALEVTAKLDAQKQATETLKKAYHDLNNAMLVQRGGIRGMEAAIDAATTALADNGKTLDINTEAGRANNQALDDIASSTMSAVEAASANGASMTAQNKIYQRGRDALIDFAKKMGLSDEAAKKLAKSILDIPPAELVFKGDVQDLDAKILDVKGKIKALVKKRSTAFGADAEELDKKLAKARKDLAALERKRTVAQVGADIIDLDRKIKKAQERIDSLKQKKKTAVGADKKHYDAALRIAQKDLDRLKQKKAVAVNAKNNASGVIGKIAADLSRLKDKDIRVTTHYSSVGTFMAAMGKADGGIVRFASGGSASMAARVGAIKGPGTGTSDSILAAISNGEYVVRAAAVDRYGTRLLDMINTGTFPRFAQGGSPSGATGAPGVSSAVSAAGKTGTFTVTDETGRPVASAVKNFQALETAVKKTYTQLNSDTAGFGRNLTSQMAVLGTQNKGVWDTWQSGIKSRTETTYTNINSRTDAFSRQQVARISQTRTSSHGVWDNWKSGMQSRTSSTYANINNATNKFSTQSVSKLGQTRDGMGRAWGGLSAKFKPPVSYLVHSVINRGIVGSMNAIMSKLGGGKKVGGISVPGFATGGPVYGAGTKTSDSIPARLSNGEFVMQAKAVDKFGMGFMNAVNKGRMPKDGAGFTGFRNGGGVNIKMNAPGFAAGGAVGIPSADTLNKIMGEGSASDVKKMTNFIMDNYVLPLISSGPGGSAMKDVQRAGMEHIRSNIQSFVKENFGGAGSASAGLRWAKTQHGKPYQWGGNGNPSWDCSGFMSAIESVIRGEKPHRRWSTHAFKGGAPSGWRAGAKSPFTIGITHAGVGHTAGTIGRTNVESSGNGVQVGSGARGTSNGMFTSRYGFVGKKALGGFIKGPGSGTSDSLMAMLSNGEYVIRAAAVKKFGTGFLNQINSGHFPGFASGGLSDSAKSARAGLIGDTTITDISKLSNTIRNPEIRGILGRPTDKYALVDALNKLQRDVNAAKFSKGTTKSLQSKITRDAKALVRHQEKLEAVNKSLEKAETALDDIRGKFDQLKSSISDNIRETGNITAIGQFGTNPQVLLDKLTKDAGKATQFSSMLDQLRGRGLSGDILSDIASSGVSSGMNTAASLLRATPEQLAEFNRLQRALGTTADRTGELVAQGMYGAGLQSAQGLVDGLKSQQSAIEDAMMALAVSMETALKKALGIKSPSRVMKPIGAFTAQGFADGVRESKKPEDAMRYIANQTVRSAVGTTSSNTGSGPGVIINELCVKIDGTHDMGNPQERRKIAKAMVVEIKDALRDYDRGRR